MKFTSAQCIDVIKAPRNRGAIDLATRQEHRLLLHCEPVQDRNSCSPALREFMMWVSSFLPADKFARFEKLVLLPIETVDSTETIFDELSKFFDTPDKYLRYEFKTAQFEQDFMEYIDKKLNDENYWSETGFDALKTGINSFMVIDLPAVQTTPRPEPYYHMVNISRVHDVVVRPKTAELEYLAFYDGHDQGKSIVFLDELAFRRFIKRDEAGSDWELTAEAIHSTYRQTTAADGLSIIYGELIEGLGYNPACSFYEYAIKGSHGINKRGPLTNALSKLDWLLFFKTSKKYLDLYGAWPIVVSYKSVCTYRDAEGNECVEGYINYEQVGPSPTDAVRKGQKECPACQKRGLIGPGSHLEVDAPRDKQESDLMENPVKFIEPSNDKLEYGVSEIERLENEIYQNTVGAQKENPTKEAINEKQVKSKYEGQRAVLDAIRKQFDGTHKFCLDTIARLRYGQYFIRGSVFGGHEYFLMSAEEIVLQYADAKKSGMPTYEIARIRESYSKTKLRNNPMEWQRSFILSQLEPYPDVTVAELRTMGYDQEDTENFLLKLNFVNFIARFEREQMNVVEFASLIPFAAKITIIQTKLLEYVKQSIGAFVKRPEPEGSAPVA